MRSLWRESISYIKIVFCVCVSTNERGLQTRERVASGNTKSGTGERRRLAHFPGEDQDPSFWCSAPFH